VREGPGRINRTHNANHADGDPSRPGGDAAFRDQRLWGDETKATDNDDAGDNG